MERCPICEEPLARAVIVCGGCGEELPFRVVVVSEGSQGGGFVLAVEEREGKKRRDMSADDSATGDTR